jgi:hypothetical protein
MTAEDLKDQIELEIAGDWARTNAHGRNLKQCLVEPVRLPFEDPHDRLATINLWLVLEEVPDTRDGYKIVYDDDRGMFGLACPSISGGNVFLGPYGDTFMEAFDAM